MEDVDFGEGEDWALVWPPQMKRMPDRSPVKIDLPIIFLKGRASIHGQKGFK
jgi:hypothetical protein